MPSRHYSLHQSRPEQEPESLPDSVELACQFVREVVEAPSHFPERADLAYRGFAVAEYWEVKGSLEQCALHREIQALQPRIGNQDCDHGLDQSRDGNDA